MTMAPLSRHWAGFTDASTCALLSLAQWRHRNHASTRADLEAYLSACEPLTRAEYYAVPDLLPLDESPRHLRWSSPHPVGPPENNIASALLYECPRGWQAPTVFILHALMSMSDVGYRRLAARFNELGWNAAILHLPFHYARRPRGYLNGELAITADLVRNARGIRQGTSEARQLMAFLRGRGCSEFGIYGTSYGGWTGAILASLEPDVSLIALLQPIADTQHAIWESPAGATLRRFLLKNGIDRSLTSRHAHLTSPLHGRPSTDPGRIILTIGAYDRIAPPDRVEALAAAWGGPRVIASPQGHFGYVAARDIFAAVQELIS